MNASRQLGININVLQPRQSLGKYHAEAGHEENILVLAGQCVLVAEDQSRDLRAWDFVHCPPGTPHMIVGAGDGPSVVLAVGARGSGKGVVYPVSDVAARYGVSVKTETTDPNEAYADLPKPRAIAYRNGWLPDFREQDL